MATTAVQHAVTGTTMQSQAAVVFSLPAKQITGSNSSLMYKKSVVRGLAITEIVLGSMCIALGAIIPAMSVTDRYVVTFGEGIWCGIWIVVAGALGIPSARIHSSRCLNYCHLAFSIVGASFAGVLFIIGVILTLVSYWSWALWCYILLDIIAFASLCLLIASASYTCCLIGCCIQSVGINNAIIYPHQTVNCVPAQIFQPANNPQGVQTAFPTIQVAYAQPPSPQNLSNTTRQNLPEQEVSSNYDPVMKYPDNAPPAYRK